MNSQHVLAIVFALAAGAALAAQPGVNGALSRRLDHPLQASVLSFVTGTMILTILAMLFRAGMPNPAQLRAVPWWGWFGGAIGALVVTSSLIFAPRIGAVAWIGLLVAGQLIASLLLDQFGLVGFGVREINLGRLIGVGFLILGVILIGRYS